MADSTDLRSEFTAGLRALADWVDQHPDIDLPYQAVNDFAGVRFSVGIQPQWDAANDEFMNDLPGRFAAAVRALGGDREKVPSDRFMTVARRFGPGVNLEIWAARDNVCEAVVVGTETVEVEEIVVPAVTAISYVERDRIEWRCTPLLEGAVS